MMIRASCEHTAPVADSAVVALGALLSTRALTLIADNVLCVGELGCLALVQLLERDLVLLLYAASLLWHVSARATRHAAEAAHAWHSPKAAHTAEHLRKDVVHVWLLAAAASGVEGGHAVGIVEVALVIVGKNLVGLFCGLEADLCLFTLLDCDLVGVVCEGSLVLLVSMVGGGHSWWRWMQPCDMPS